MRLLCCRWIHDDQRGDKPGQYTPLGGSSGLRDSDGRSEGESRIFRQRIATASRLREGLHVQIPEGGRYDSGRGDGRRRGRRQGGQEGSAQQKEKENADGVLKEPSVPAGVDVRHETLSFQLRTRWTGGIAAPHGDPGEDLVPEQEKQVETAAGGGAGGGEHGPRRSTAGPSADPLPRRAHASVHPQLHRLQLPALLSTPAQSAGVSTGQPRRLQGPASKPRLRVPGPRITCSPPCTQAMRVLAPRLECSL